MTAITMDEDTHPAPAVDPFGQFQYPTSPEATATADPEHANLASASRAAQRLVMDKGNLR